MSSSSELKSRRPENLSSNLLLRIRHDETTTTTTAEVDGPLTYVVTQQGHPRNAIQSPLTATTQFRPFERHRSHASAINNNSKQYQVLKISCLSRSHQGRHKFRMCYSHDFNILIARDFSHRSWNTRNLYCETDKLFQNKHQVY